MTDTPKFEVIDRRKYKGAEEAQHNAAPEPASKPEPEQPAAPEAAKSAGPRLVTPEPPAPEPAAEGAPEDDFAAEPPLPPPPTAEESREQKSAYEASSQRLEDLVRAQNPAAGTQPPMTFENLVQQLYVSAMIQMGAASPEGQRPRVDILGARQTIDLLGILQEKTKGNLTPTEERILDSVLFEARMAFLELTNMIAMPGVQAPPPTPQR
jgi:hypothetical protein